ncbi:unnamed protein product [Mytilus edulis]|uniref:Reverse transcriptase domain-containing protein n=1 Tax=Mytilus edulis TaxID=6550 RepID=A0A8S3T9A8_MYTED|nr:unnamed protein product [Mytilus edulis]
MAAADVIGENIQPIYPPVYESWLDNTVTNAEIHIEGYNVVRLDRSRNGGGCVFIREDIAFSPRQDLHDDRLEALWIDIFIPKTKTITIGTVYRPPKEASFLINFEEILNDLKQLLCERTRITENSIVPDEMKTARVCPIFKKNSRLDVGNYRPVSILIVVSKIVERSVYSQLEKYLVENDLLYNLQSGFRSAYSTDTCLIHLLDHIKNETAKGLYTGMIMLDLQKAFDTVDHLILCNKLQKMGVKCTKWFESYLCNRQQKVNINGTESYLRYITLYIDSNLESTEVNMEAQFQENIFMKIKLNQNDKLLIGLIYRSPSNNTKE